MQSKIIDRTEKDRDNALERLSEIEAAKNKVIIETNDAEDELAKLKGQLADLLAQAALGAAVAPEIVTVRALIAEAQQTINDAPLVQAGLEALKRPLSKQLREARQLLSKAAEYGRIKEQLTAETKASGRYSDRLAIGLRDFAEHLGLEYDREEFLKSIKK